MQILLLVPSCSQVFFKKKLSNCWQRLIFAVAFGGYWWISPGGLFSPTAWDVDEFSADKCVKTWPSWLSWTTESGACFQPLLYNYLLASRALVRNIRELIQCKMQETGYCWTMIATYHNPSQSQDNIITFQNLSEPLMISSLKPIQLGIL